MPHPQYENIFHTVHNNVLLAALLVTYLVFCAILFVQSMNSGSTNARSFSQKMVGFGFCA